MKLHGNTGKTNAVKKVTASEKLSLRCYPKDKNKWTKTAKKHKLGLTQWITKTLNDAIVEDRLWKKK